MSDKINPNTTALPADPSRVYRPVINKPATRATQAGDAGVLLRDAADRLRAALSTARESAPGLIPDRETDPGDLYPVDGWPQKTGRTVARTRKDGSTYQIEIPGLARLNGSPLHSFTGEDGKPYLGKIDGSRMMLRAGADNAFAALTYRAIHSDALRALAKVEPSARTDKGARAAQRVLARALARDPGASIVDNVPMTPDADADAESVSA